MSYSDEPRKLGSLSQSARKGKLNLLRGILIFVGVVQMAVPAYELANLDELIDKEVQKAGGFVDFEEVERVKDFIRIGDTILLGVGVLFIIFGILVHTHPVPISILSLVIYVSLHVIVALIVGDPSYLFRGILVKALIVIGMIKGIQTAQAYQAEREREERRRGLDDDSDDYYDDGVERRFGARGEPDDDRFQRF